MDNGLYEEPVQGPAQLREEFSPKKFLDKVPLKDTSGGDLPPWKRQIIAKQMAEKAQKEADELKKKEAEEARYRDLPPWKQAILKKKEAQAREDEEKKRKEMPSLGGGRPEEEEFPMVPWQAELRTKRLSQQIMEQQFGSK